ncbi:MAG: TIGR04219 family outer membrane beta-barrel protein, partial [Campylobacterota bacterium]|nr:TIGR04219 family outer membrane beta-barrel protein [Campylobacterota bacterium]
QIGVYNMKKILTTLAVGAMLATAANADLARVEAGLGSWMQTPTGGGTTSDSDGVLSLDGTYTSSEKDSSEMYLWMLIKHPIPIVPNIRLEYVTIADEGHTTGTVDGLEAVNAPTTIDMTQFDIIPYYNILDNTGWATLDLGLDLKIIQNDAKVTELTPLPIAGDVNSYSSSETTVIPLLYVRTRAEIPATNIGLEADVKFITDGDSTVYDIRAKVDYTLDFIPVVQPAIELGYRIQKFDVDDTDTKMDLEYSGVYLGAMVRF